MELLNPQTGVWLAIIPAGIALGVLILMIVISAVAKKKKKGKK